MFDDILGRDEEIFYEGDENPIEFEYEPKPKDDHGPVPDPSYGEDDEQEEEPFHERLRRFIKDYYDEPEVCDGDCDDCAQDPPPDRPKDTGKDDPLSCRVCGQSVSVPKAVHQFCYEKLVREGKWNNYNT
jgi:hypothetical protein